jgi:DNA-binding beta-propeller fold protein YncE
MYDNQYKVLPENMSFPVLAILAPGVTKLTGYAKPKILSTLTSSVQPIAAQSIAFNRLGNKAYAYCVQPIPDTNSDKATKSVAEQPMEVKDFIMEFTVARGGIIADTGKRWEVDFIGRSQLFGVDTIAFDDYDNNHLWISNMTVSDGRSHLQVLDVTTGAVIKTIPFAPIVMGDPPKSKDTIPTGIAFWRN